MTFALAIPFLPVTPLALIKYVELDHHLSPRNF